MQNKNNLWPVRAFFFTLLCSQAVTVHAAPPTPGAVKEPFSGPSLQAPVPDSVPPIKQDATTPAKTLKSSKRIQVNKFFISGNVAISSEELLSQISELQGQKLSLDEIYAAAEILTEFYRSRGYSLARVVVPAQRVNLGVIEFEVIEGLLNEVKYEGNEAYSNEVINEYLGSLQTGKAVTLDALERELLLLNDLPGLSSRAVIRPGPVYGTSDLVITSKEKPFFGRVSFNNYGRVEVGEWRLEGEFIFNNLSGKGDQLSIAITKSENDLLEYSSIAYNAPINNRGTRLGGVFSYIDYRVGGEFGALDIEGDNADFRLTLSHPYQRSRRQNILFGLSLGSNASESSTLGVTTRDDNITLLEGSMLVNKVHANNSVSTVTVVASTNFRDNEDGLEENRQKLKLEIDGNHLRALSKQWSLFLRGVIAVSADPLVDSEKYSIGGQGSVRGFPSAEVRGDQGFLFTTEVRRSFNLEGTLPGSARVFFDTGRVYRKVPIAGEEEEENLSSLGIGVSFLPGPNVSIDLEYARPIDAHETTDGRSGGRFWVNITARF